MAVVDSSVAGLGGCPYAEGATGNVPTEVIALFCFVFVFFCLIIYFIFIVFNVLHMLYALCAEGATGNVLIKVRAQCFSYAERSCESLEFVCFF